MLHLSTKIILVHGLNTNPTEKWYPLFITSMNEKGYNAICPELPEPEDPEVSKWIKEIELLDPDENTILIGHSRGGVAVMRYLEQVANNIKFETVILVATNSGSGTERPEGESDKGFYTEDGFNFEKIKTHSDNFIVLHSKDDPWVPYASGLENAKGLGVEIVSFEDKLHFGRNLVETGFPELEAIIENRK